eukprot:TRINITY_DN3147_c0_g1_i4.p1 TRINITY_DN3147_c0_g1~~TRINITY_DN3147_c0_g1_i4.p1  ORF type:complete len:271 (-),score=104.69 TRINITY_DN3147_c0_g1_i4:273-1085(-)
MHKDRTQEFNSVAESVRSKQANQKPWKNTAKSQKSKFMIVAAQIGRDIYDTTEKLHKLTALARNKSLFNDPTVEIEELTFIIKQDIQNLNRQIGTLHDFSGTGSNNSKQGEAHSNTVITYLNSKLSDTTKGFKDVLSVRTETLKSQQERRQRFTGTTPVTPPPSRALSTASSSSSANSGVNSSSSSPSSSGSVDVGGEGGGGGGGGRRWEPNTPPHVLRHRRAVPSSSSSSSDQDPYSSRHHDLPESQTRTGGEVAISMPSILIQQEEWW